MCDSVISYILYTENKEGSSGHALSDLWAPLSDMWPPLGDMCATLIDLQAPLRNIIDPFPLLRHHYAKREKVRIN